MKIQWILLIMIILLIIGVVDFFTVNLFPEWVSIILSLIGVIGNGVIFRSLSLSENNY